MSLSVIMEEPLGFGESDLEFVGRISHSRNPGRTQTHGRGSREPSQGRYGSPKGRYIKAPAGRSLGGLRLGGGQSYSPNNHGRGTGRDFFPNVRPIRFVRNPRHPKSLYNTEITMRHFMQGRMLKVTPGMAFPDPKNLRAIRNPAAPRFHHEYDLTEDDFNIMSNPLAGVDLDAFAGGGGGFGPTYNRGYDDTGDNDTTTTEDSSDDQEQGMSSVAGSEAEYDITADDSVSRRGGRRFHEPKDAPTAIYSSVKKYYQAPRAPGPQLASDPPTFEPQPPPTDVASVHLPRVSTHHEASTSAGPSRQSPQDREAPPILPKPLHTLTEEDTEEDEAKEAAAEEVEKIPEVPEPQTVVDMSTQTKVTVQDTGETVEDEANEDEANEDEANEDEDRFVQIPEGRGDSEVMSHDNWEVVAPWSQRSSGAQVTRSESLAVNYRRVVAELIGNERLATSVEPQPDDQRRSSQQRYSSPPEDPPPWSPPAEPSRMARELNYPESPRELNYHESPHEWDQYSRRYRRSMSGFWNLCCFVILMVLALLVVSAAIVVTALYVGYLSECADSANCGLLQKQGYLAGYVTTGAAAILIVFALFTWCCYNMTRRQRGINKYRPREPERMYQIES